MRSRLFLFGRSLSLLCWVTLLFVGCQKEYGAKRFSIFTESYRGAAKVVVDGLSSSWRAGDGIWVNGEQGSVALDNNGAPILDVSVTNWEYGYYASYPASSVVAGARDGTLTLTLPQAYQYREDATTHKQLLEMPMVAYTEYDRLEFKHLTGALVVEVPHVTRDIVLDYIMVRSSTSPLSGTGTVDVRAENPQVVFESDTTHTVVMYFDRCPVTIANSESPKSIMIPIAPTTGNNHKFTVTVCAHSHYTPLEFFFFNKESNAGNLMRNEVAVAPVPSLSSRTIPLVGSGSSTSPYLIQNKVDYKNFLYFISNNLFDANDDWYRLVNDIDFGGDTVTSVTDIYGFYGKFDGNGKVLKNVAVLGVNSNSLSYNYHYISPFPAITGGWVQNLSMVNIRLIVPRSGPYTDIFAGGFSSFVKSFNNGVVLNNIQVSNILFDYPSNSYSITRFSMGGIVGKLVESGSGHLTMTSCSYSQVDVGNFYFLGSVTNLFFGGLIGYIVGTDVSMAGCRVSFGGNPNDMGTIVRSIYSDNSYVGSVIGNSTDNTIRIDNSLLLEGYIQFIGAHGNHVKRIIGSSSSVQCDIVVDAINLHLWKMNDMVSPNSEVTDDY